MKKLSEKGVGFIWIFNITHKGSLDNFEGEGKDYLVNSGVEQILPIDCSQYLNPHSLKLYEDYGIDLRF